MKLRLFAAAFVLLLVVVYATAQQAGPFTAQATKKATEVAGAATPIEVPVQALETLATVNQAIEVAQLRKQNYLLQLRLVLKVPNEFEWDETAKAFKPPKPAETVKPPAKSEPAKP